MLWEISYGGAETDLTLACFLQVHSLHYISDMSSSKNYH